MCRPVPKRRIVLTSSGLLLVLFLIVVAQMSVIVHLYWNSGIVGSAHTLSPVFVNSSLGEHVVRNSIADLVQSKMVLQQGIKLKWIRQRIERLSLSWEKARDEVITLNSHLFSDPKHILLFPGLLSEYSAYDFANMAFKGGYLGELTQWSDLIATLHMLGHMVVIATSYGQLMQATSKGIYYDILITDYLGMYAVHDAQLVGAYKCRLRIVDSFGTEPKFGFRTGSFRADPDGDMFSSWGLQSYRQFWTLYPHTPDNSFLGFVMEHPLRSLPHHMRKNQAVIYGKEGSYVHEHQHYLNLIGSFIELHATMNDPSSELPAHFVNHGVLSPDKLIKLLQESRLFIGLGFPYEGPGPLEALANGCAFIHPKFSEPHNKYNKEFFHGKPTERGYTSQNPYLEEHVGEPYVYTVDPRNEESVKRAVLTALQRTNFSSFIPYEFTQEGMLERIGKYIHHQDFCKKNNRALNRQAWSSHHKASAGGPVDGKDTPDSCFKSQNTVESRWWMVDLAIELIIDSVVISYAFDWHDTEDLGLPVIPFQVSLVDSHGQSVATKVYRDVRLSYSWFDINMSARYIRVETLPGEEDSSPLVVCSVGVYSRAETTPRYWPHPSLLKTVHSAVSETCRDACIRNRMICEPEFFTLLNDWKAVQESFGCKKTIEVDQNYVAYAPAIATADDSVLNVSSGDCIINGFRELLGCAGHHKTYRRLCPCRTYKKRQMALPID